MNNKSNIPVFILAGGLGTRLSEETQSIPKPMVEVGGIPILIHIMRWYYRFGFNDFVICAGYKSSVIKNFFKNYTLQQSHIEVDWRTGNSKINVVPCDSNKPEKWRVRVLDTGDASMTGSRVAKALQFLKNDVFTDFGLTYGDGLTDANLDKELSFHKEHNKIGTVLGVHPVARFGELEIGKDNSVTSFKEKLQSQNDFINGGFFFFKREFGKYLETQDSCILEKKPLINLADDGQLKVFKHEGFWHPMDTLRDKNHLESWWKEYKNILLD